MDRPLHLKDIPSFHTEWTSDEIKARNFRGSFFGFRRGEVRDFLRAISKLWQRMLEHQQILTDRIALLEGKVAEFTAREVEITQKTEQAQAQARAILDEAHSEARKLLTETEDKAGSIRKRTENWLEEVIAKVEETQRQKTNFLTAFRSALDSHYELIKSEQDEAEPLTAKLSDVLRGSADSSLN